MIAVIGATGYIGRYLCVDMKGKGMDVLALGRSEKVKDFFLKQNIPFQYFDFTEKGAFDMLKNKNIDAIVDLSACIAEHETPVEEFFKVNTLGVYNILEFARLNNIKKVVVTSSHKVYNDIHKNVISESDGISFTGDHSPYIISKIAAENFVEYYNKDFDMQGIVFRLTGAHGYGEILGHLNKDGSYVKSTFEKFFEKALVGDDIEVWGDQSIKRDHIYIKDVVYAIEAAVLSKTAKGIYNIASGIGYSQYEEAKILAKVFSTGKVSNVILKEDKPGLIRGYLYSIDKVMKDLDWKPVFADLYDAYMDYKMEWERKVFKNYHFINESDKPKTF